MRRQKIDVGCPCKGKVQSIRGIFGCGFYKATKASIACSFNFIRISDSQPQYCHTNTLSQGTGIEERITDIYFDIQELLYDKQLDVGANWKNQTYLKNKLVLACLIVRRDREKCNRSLRSFQGLQVFQTNFSM